MPPPVLWSSAAKDEVYACTKFADYDNADAGVVGDDVDADNDDDHNHVYDDDDGYL